MTHPVLRVQVQVLVQVPGMPGSLLFAKFGIHQLIHVRQKIFHFRREVVLVHLRSSQLMTEVFHGKLCRCVLYRTPSARSKAIQSSQQEPIASSPRSHKSSSPHTRDSWRTFTIESKSKKRKADSISNISMGNAASSSSRNSMDQTEAFQLSDRELARQLIDSKRKRTVQFSDASAASGSSVGAETRSSSVGAEDSVSLRAGNLRSNLMRVQKDRDPMFYYEIIKVVGVGSMGSVAMVKKRDEVIGGSARKKLVKSLRQEKRKNVCFKLPIVGDLLRHCFEAFDGSGGHQNSKGALRNPLLSQTSGTSVASDDKWSTTSVGSRKASALYALKSIHLSQVADQVFVEELKNEIEILKKLVSADYCDDYDDDDNYLILISYSFRIIPTSFVQLKRLFIKISCALLWNSVPGVTCTLAILTQKTRQLASLGPLSARYHSCTTRRSCIGISSMRIFSSRMTVPCRKSSSLILVCRKSMLRKKSSRRESER